MDEQHEFLQATHRAPQRGTDEYQLDLILLEHWVQHAFELAAVLELDGDPLALKRVGGAYSGRVHPVRRESARGQQQTEGEGGRQRVSARRANHAP